MRTRRRGRSAGARRPCARASAAAASDGCEDAMPNSVRASPRSSGHRRAPSAAAAALHHRPASSSCARTTVCALGCSRASCARVRVHGFGHVMTVPRCRSGCFTCFVQRSPATSARPRPAHEAPARWPPTASSSPRSRRPASPSPSSRAWACCSRPRRPLSLERALRRTRALPPRREPRRGRPGPARRGQARGGPERPPLQARERERRAGAPLRARAGRARWPASSASSRGSSPRSATRSARPSDPIVERLRR